MRQIWLLRNLSTIVLYVMYHVFLSIQFFLPKLSVFERMNNIKCIEKHSCWICQRISILKYFVLTWDSELTVAVFKTQNTSYLKRINTFYESKSQEINMWCQEDTWSLTRRHKELTIRYNRLPLSAVVVSSPFWSLIHSGLLKFVINVLYNTL